METHKAVLSRDQILVAEDSQQEYVEIPEWHGGVYVRSLTAEERDAYEGSLVEVRGKKVELRKENARAKLVALTVVDAAGARLFTEADVERLGKKNGAALDRIYKVAQRLSAMRQEDLEGAVKNSDGDPGGGSSSA
jgi:hypothetical protein